MGVSGIHEKQAGEADFRSVRTLNYTKADLYVLWMRSEECKVAKEKGASVCRTKWHDLLRNEFFEFVRAKRRLDVCDTCLDFLRKATPMFKSCLSTARSPVEKVLGGYFKVFDSKCGHIITKDMLTAKHFTVLEKYIRIPCPEHVGMRNKLPRRQLHDLRDAEGTAALSLRVSIPKFQCYEHHWQSFQRQHAHALKQHEELKVGMLF